MNKALLASLCTIPLAAGVVLATKSSSAAPHSMILDCAQAARNNDVSRLMGLLASKEQIATLEAEWDTKRALAIEPADEMSFQMALGMLTSEGAETALMAQLEPKLAEMREQLPFMAQMVSGMAIAQIDDKGNLTPEQRAESEAVLEAIKDLLVSGDMTDSAHARSAIDILCRTARSLEIDSLQALRALEFEQVLSKANLALAGTKEILAVYGIDIDAFLDSTEAKTLEESNGYARVHVSYQMLGMKRDTEIELEFVEGRWTPKKNEESL